MALEESNRIKLVHIITTLDAGGAENHLLSLTKSQTASGLHVDVAFLRGDGGLSAAFKESGCREVRKVELDGFAHLPGVLFRLAQLLRQGRYHIVHTHCLKANALGGLAAKLAGNRVVVASKHNDDQWLRNPLISWLHGVVSRLCDSAVIGISDHVCQFAITRGHVPRHKVHRIYYGLDPDSLRTTDCDRKPFGKLGIDKDAVTMGVFARVVPQKGHLELLDAVALAKQKIPNLKLLIVGRNDHDIPYCQKVLSRIRTLSIQESVEITGFREDVHSIMKSVDILVLPSHWEGLGLVLLEGMALAKPVIATRVSAIPEVVRNGVDGILVAPGDVRGLASAMVQLARDSRLRALMGNNGRQRVASKFSYDAMCNQTTRLYGRLLQERGQPQA